MPAGGTVRMGSILEIMFGFMVDEHYMNLGLSYIT